MCAKFGCGPTVVSKKGGVGLYTYRQTDKGTLQLYIVGLDEESIMLNPNNEQNCILTRQKFQQALVWNTSQADPVTVAYPELVSRGVSKSRKM